MAAEHHADTHLHANGKAGVGAEAADLMVRVRRRYTAPNCSVVRLTDVVRNGASGSADNPALPVSFQSAPAP
jgi:hypothetical protein